MRQSAMRIGMDTPVEGFFGIGEKRAEAFHRLGLFAARDLVFHFPRGYENRGNVKTTRSAEDGEVCSLILTVANTPKSVMIRRGMTLTKLTAFDELGKCQITYFNQTYVKDSLPQGATFRFYGKIKREGLGVSMSSPVFEPVGGRVPLRPLVPLYPLTEGISQKLMGQTIRAALAALSENGIEEYLPADLLRKYELCDISSALTKIHEPKTEKEAEAAARRLAFGEMYLFAVRAMLYGKKPKDKVKKRLPKPNREAFLSELPYALTKAQMRTADALEADMTGNTRMARLVIGDVGSGKTVCAAYAAYITLSGDRQAALMAPTEILARQHFADLTPLFEVLGFRTALLVGSMTAAAKRKALMSIADGTADLIIGTHALIEDSVIYHDLGLAIVDEQHRFGAGQRTALMKKGKDVHELSMSATPIPRTLAMVLYCDTDISVIDELPPGRQKVDTFLVGESYRERLNAFIRKNVEAGGQVYIVCPVIEDEEKIESESGEMLSAGDLFSLYDREEKPKLKAAVDYAKTLSEEVFPDLSCAFLHGKQTGAAKEKTMRDFAEGKISVLVSTTVIEVGVNVPSATLMIVENADFFGLSALHQLRGRVGRGTKKSYFILVSDSKTEKAKARLSTLCECSDGFSIAERDLELRGPGDFIEQTAGRTRQSGELALGIAKNFGEPKLLAAAFEEAKHTLAVDSALAGEENRTLLKIASLQKGVL